MPWNIKQQQPGGSGGGSPCQAKPAFAWRGAGRRVPGAGCRAPGAGCPNKGGGSLARRQIRRFNQGKWKNVKNKLKTMHFRNYNAGRRARHRRVPGAGCPNNNKGGGSLARRQIRRFNQGKWKNVKNMTRHLRTYNYIYITLDLKHSGFFNLNNYLKMAMS